MLEFREFSIKDRGEMEKYLINNTFRACDMGFQNMFLWRKQYEFNICIKDDFLFFRSLGDQHDCRHYYKFPLGKGDLVKAVEALIEHTKEAGERLRFFALPEAAKEALDAALPGRFEFTENRDASDYIYLSETLDTLAGKKLHSKRNFINRFYQTYGDLVSVDPINPDDLDELREFHKKWCETMQDDPDLAKETCAVIQAFDNYAALDLKGLVLKVGGKIVAFSYGSELTPDTFDVHVEKADTDYAGSYPLINNLMAQEFGSKYKYFNREEDMGVEGLRKAKLSYQPEIILYRWNAVLK